MAKHANPFLSMLHGLRVDSSVPYFACGPDCSDLGIHMSARALWYAVGFGTFGIHVALGHCSDDALKTQLSTEASSINERLHGLESWYLEVIGPESPLKSQKEASALSSEAQRLESETDRLRRETKRMKQETLRLKQETRKIRHAR
jgi:outer membrane murein-binding lipoprotein Lpp